MKCCLILCTVAQQALWVIGLQMNCFTVQDYIMQNSSHLFTKDFREPGDPSEGFKCWTIFFLHPLWQKGDSRMHLPLSHRCWQQVGVEGSGEEAFASVAGCHGGSGDRLPPSCWCPVIPEPFITARWESDMRCPWTPQLPAFLTFPSGSHHW